MIRCTVRPVVTLVSALLCLAPFGATAARARPRLDGPAIVVGFHVTPAGPGEALELPMAPAELRPGAPNLGLFDVWLVVFTRAPLVGAWTLNVGLGYDARPERGVDLLGWEALSDIVRPRPGWPAAGAGFGAEFVWDRRRCWDVDRRLTRGRDGWWVQVACRLRARVHSADSLTLADPEPDVRPAEVECYDEGHDLDGTDNWTAIVPAVFDAVGGPAAGGDAHAPAWPPASGGALPVPTPVRGLTWSQLKRGTGGR